MPGARASRGHGHPKGRGLEEQGCCLCRSSHGSVEGHFTGARKNQGKHRSPPRPARGVSVLQAGHHPVQTAACQQGSLSQEARAKVSARRPPAQPEPGRQPPSGEEVCADALPEPTVARLGHQAAPTPRSPSSFQAALGFLWLRGGHSRPPHLVSCQALSPKPRSSCPEPHCRQPRRPPRPLEPSPHPRPPQGPDTLLFRGVHSRPNQGDRPRHASSPERTWQRHPPSWCPPSTDLH